MKLEDIIRPHGIRLTESTLHKLRLVSVHSKRKQNDVLNELLTTEMKRLNVKA